MREKWLDPDYRAAREESARLRREHTAERSRAANALFLDPATRPFVEARPGNPREKIVAYIDAQLKPLDDAFKAKLQQLYSERQRRQELLKAARKQQRDTMSAERKALLARGQELRRQARELYRQAHELEAKARAGEGPGSQIDSRC